MNSIYVNPTMVLSANPRSTPTPPPAHIQPFVTSNNRYFLIRHSPSNNYQQHSNHHQQNIHHPNLHFHQRPHPPQMRLQYINMPPSPSSGFIGYPLRKTSSSTNLQFQVHPIKAGEFFFILGVTLGLFLVRFVVGFLWKTCPVSSFFLNITFSYYQFNVLLGIQSIE